MFYTVKLRRIGLCVYHTFGYAAKPQRIMSKTPQGQQLSYVATFLFIVLIQTYLEHDTRLLDWSGYLDTVKQCVIPAMEYSIVMEKLNKGSLFFVVVLFISLLFTQLYYSCFINPIIFLCLLGFFVGFAFISLLPN